MTISASRNRHRSALVFLLVAALLATGVVFAPSQADAADTRRARMVRLTNDDREARDRRALDLDALLSRYAKRHSRDMAEAGQIFHTEDLAAKLRGRDWSIAGENVGMGTSLDGLEEAFMASKPHRRNILRRDYDDVAVGVVESDGNLWVTVIFYG